MGISYNPPSGGGLSLGETSTTAYRGDRGKTGYDHSQVSGNPHGVSVVNLTGLGANVASALANALNANDGMISLDSEGKLPAVDASQLTNLPPGGGVFKGVNYFPYTVTASVAGTTWYSPGITCSLTPVSGSTGIIAIAFINLGTSSSSYCAIARLLSDVAGGMTIGDTAGLRTSCAVASALSTSQVTECTIFDVELLVGNYAARTYDVQIASVNAGATAYINRTGGDANAASVVRTASGLLLLNY